MSELEDLRAMRAAVAGALDDAAAFVASDRVWRLVQIRDALLGAAAVGRRRQSELVGSEGARGGGYPWAEFEVLIGQVEAQATAAAILVLEVLGTRDDLAVDGPGASRRD